MKIKYIVLLLGLVVASGCTSAASTQKSVEVENPFVKEHVVKPSNKDIEIFRELVVALCPDVKMSDVKSALNQAMFIITKQSSPTILTVSWSDARGLESAKQALLEEKGLFCHVQENYEYNAIKSFKEGESKYK